MSIDKGLKDFLRTGAGIFLAGTIGYVLMFFIKLVVARQLGPSGFGLYEMMITILGVMTLIANFGLKSGIQRFFSLYKANKNYKHFKGFMIFIVVIQIISSVLVALMLWLFSESITAYFGFDAIFSSMLQVLAFAVPFFVFNRNFQNYFHVYKKGFLSKTGTNIIENLVFFVGALILIYYDFGVFYLSVIVVVSMLASFGFYLYHFTRFTYDIKGDVSPSYEYKRWLKYSIPLLFAGVVGTALKWTDNFVIGRFLTETELGIYSVAFSLAAYLFFAPQILGTMFIPIMTDYYENHRRKFKHIFQTVRTWTFMFASGVGLAFIGFSEEILALLFGTDFIGGGASLTVLAIFLLMSTYFYFYTNILNLNEDTVAIFWIKSGFLVFNLVFTIFLVGEIGILGAAIGSGMTNLLLHVALYYRSTKYINISFETRDVWILILLIASMGVSYIVLQLSYYFVSIPPLFAVVGASIVYGSLFVIGFIYFKLGNKNDLIVFDMAENVTGLDLTRIKNYFVN